MTYGGSKPMPNDLLSSQYEDDARFAQILNAGGNRSVITLLLRSYRELQKQTVLLGQIQAQLRSAFDPSEGNTTELSYIRLQVARLEEVAAGVTRSCGILSRMEARMEEPVLDPEGRPGKPGMKDVTP
jgi:hypothetical protein